MKKSAIVVFAVLAVAVVSAPAADAKATWDKSCAKCHGVDGKGETKAGKKAEVKDMTDAKWQASFTDDKAFTSIKDGIKDGDKIRMKPAEGLSDDEIKTLVAYVRTFKK